ncbi:MAG TPA: sigma-70 family RNA polymerase sigma factor [Pirellulales bacterium]|jgi:RNA polymerase sigma factor (sigma-70 family)
MSEDQQLLSEYTAAGSQSALTQLIGRYYALVYSAALRQVRNCSLAEDVTQAVFLILTQKAGSIRSGMAVGGWLLAVTRCTAVNAMKKQSIAAKHERLAAKPEAIAAADDTWQDIAPHLDAELNRLARIDRDAVVLRFFLDRSFSEIGAELGFSAEAARKRVARALERLRARLSKPSRPLTAGVLGMAIGAHAVQAAPNHLLAGAVAATAGGANLYSISLAKGTTKMLIWAKAKLLMTVAGSVIVGGAGIAAVVHAVGKHAANPSAVAADSAEVADDQKDVQSTVAQAPAAPAFAEEHPTAANSAPAAANAVTARQANSTDPAPAETSVVTVTQMKPGAAPTPNGAVNETVATQVAGQSPPQPQSGQPAADQGQLQIFNVTLQSNGADANSYPTPPVNGTITEADGSTVTGTFNLSVPTASPETQEQPYAPTPAAPQGN